MTTAPLSNAPSPTPLAAGPALRAGASDYRADAGARAIAAAMHARNPVAAPLEAMPDIHPGRLPRHIAFIMDGNGRWAKGRGLVREMGHQAGAKAVRRVIEACAELGVEVVTLYSFSLENWKRPAAEVEALMQLCVAYLALEEAEMTAKNIRFRVIGRREGLPPEVVGAIERVENSTRTNTAATLCLAINYGSRAELADAARRIAQDVAAGRLDPNTVDENALASRLYAPDLPEPDLLVRTAGEMRVSNFLLWQISYAELFVTDVLWPDFGRDHVHAAVRAFAQRTRRFGAIEEAHPASALNNGPRAHG